jgi:hypothetical protein
MFSAIRLSGDGFQKAGSARWSEIHPDRLTSNWMEAQSQLNRIEWGNHEKGKEARQIQEFIETTS